MKLAILHISDIHIKNKKDIDSSKIKKMVQVLNKINSFDKICVLVTGDIAFSGKKKQYKTAKKMFDKIKKQIKKQFNIAPVKILLVPGNHDVDLSCDIGHEAIEKKVNAGISNEDIVAETKKQRNYYKFAKEFKCVASPKDLYHVETIHAGDKKIKIGMVNTAIFSTLEEDKGLHYLPDDILDRIETSLDADINIVAFHHAHHWMIAPVKSKLERILMNRADVVICGHEHEMHQKTIKENGDTLIYLTGGILSNKGDWSKSEFYTDIIDTEEKEIISQKFIWNDKQGMYVCAPNETFPILRNVMCSEFMLDDVFAELLQKDEMNIVTDNVFDYYVFPDLRRAIEKNNKENSDITSEKEFIEVIKKYKTLYIVGDNESGKTLLLKKMFIELNNCGYTCIYCDAEKIKNYSLKIFQQKAFYNNYKPDGYSFDKYTQMPNSTRVALLDDMHEVQKEYLKLLLDYVNSYCDIIICSIKDEIEIDVKQRIIQSFESEQYQRFKILPMYMKKRKKLITNIVKIKERGGNYELIANNIANIITGQRKMYSFNPSFIIQFTDYYLKNFRDIASTDGSIFSKAFETSIVSRLNPVIRKYTVDKIMILLDKIAYWCFAEKQSDISEKSISDIIDKYNKINGDVVELISVMNMCVAAGIIIRSNIEGHYRFSDRSVMSYFIAREIIRRCNDEGYDEDYMYCIKYIRYGINAIILLFITYLTDDMFFIKELVERTIEYTKDWERVDIVNVNIKYLVLANGKLEVNTPTDEAKEQLELQETEEDRAEIEAVINEKIKVKDYFDSNTEDSEDELNQVLRGIVLLDLVAKCLPAFEHRMTKEDKDKMLNIIFQLPGKLFYIWAKQVEEDRDGLIEYLLQKYRLIYYKEKTSKNVDQDDMLRYLQQESLSFLLDLIDISVINSCKEYTLRYFEEYDTDNNPLFIIEKLSAYCQMDNTQKVLDLLKELDSTYKKGITDYLKRRLIYRYLIFSENIQNRTIQKLISKYFNTHRGNNTFRNVLISRKKNQENNEKR